MAPRPLASPALLVLLAVAIAAGAAASLLAAAPEQYVPTAGHTFDFQLPATAYGLLAITPFALCFVGVLLTRARGRAGPSGALAGVVVVGLLLLAFVLLSWVGGVGGADLAQWITKSPSTPTNNSSGPPGHNPPSCVGNGTCSSAAPPSLWGLPGWFPLVAIAVVGLVVVALVVPALAGRVGRSGLPRSADGPPTRRADARAALTDAAARLNGATDPRTVIIELYLRLLGHVAPLAGDLDPQTAEEIRELYLLPLGVRRDAADQLTRLFEEARYSTHAMGPEASRRALDAIRAAEADLLRVPRAR
jgi:hypothetical protein